MRTRSWAGHGKQAALGTRRVGLAASPLPIRGLGWCARWLTCRAKVPCVAAREPHQQCSLVVVAATLCGSGSTSSIAGPVGGDARGEPPRGGGGRVPGRAGRGQRRVHLHAQPGARAVGGHVELRAPRRGVAWRCVGGWMRKLLAGASRLCGGRVAGRAHNLPCPRALFPPQHPITTAPCHTHQPHPTPPTSVAPPKSLCLDHHIH